MKRFISFILVLTVLLSCISASALTINYKDIEANPSLKNILVEARKYLFETKRNTSGDYFTPPLEHPRVILTDKVKTEILELKETNSKYKRSFDYVKSMAEKPLPELTGLISTSVKNQISAQAFMYQFGGLTDEQARALADYTVEYLLTSKTAVPNSGTIAIYKDYGCNGIIPASYVYDWCYDALSDTQRIALADAIVKMYEHPEQIGFDSYKSVFKNNAISGSLVGWPLVINTTAALAVYDMYPELYDTMMPGVLGPMAELAKIYAEAGVLSDGSIAYTREYYSFYVMEMFDAIGYEKMYGEASPVGYKMLYSRLPYGGLVRQGDDFSQPVVAVGNYIQGAEIYDMGTLGAYFDDPYLTFGRDILMGDSASLDNLLFYRSAVEPELPDDLPLAFKGDEPRSEITARTSWQMGYDSPAVVAYMNMNNRRTGDHDHGDIGNFQIYYKGPLAMKTGVYAGDNWGKTHWKNYMTRSIAANCMLIRNPSEVYDYIHSPVSNDGGQLMSSDLVGWAYGYSGPDNHFDDELNLWSTEEGYYIGPNDITPAFSYLKGDITPAYNEKKVENYTRSMVFMDLFESDYPAAMIVFDRVVSAKAEYEKAWLLHGAEEPTIDGNKTTFAATGEGFNGKLVNTTMYPQKPNIVKIGGEGKEYMVGDENHPAPNAVANEYFSGAWRVEVIPSKQEKEDLFLNSMYVTDYDRNLPYLNQECVETDKMVGVSIKDRLVMFAKDSQPIADKFEITVPDNGNKEVMCLFTDVAAGNWKIGNTVVKSEEGSNAVMFTLAPGKYTATKTEEEAVEITYPEMPKVKNGDFIIRDGNVFQNLPYENRLIDGKPYVPAAAFFEKFADAETLASGNTLTVKNNKFEIAFTEGSSEFVYKKDGVSAKAKLDGEAKMLDGILYINPSTTGKVLGISGSYSANSKVLRLLKTDIAESTVTKLEGVDESRVLWPVEISASTDDGNGPFNTIDRDLSTRWSSTQGDGEWISFDLGEVYEIDSVLIAFYNGDIRHWKFDLEVSNDGINFKTIHKGLKSGGQTKNVEEFKLPAGTSARYVRYVGHGEEVTASLYNSLTQVIICK